MYKHTNIHALHNRTSVYVYAHAIAHFCARHQRVAFSMAVKQQYLDVPDQGRDHLSVILSPLATGIFD